MTLWICCPLWLQLELRWSCFTPCLTCPVSLPRWSCSTGSGTHRRKTASHRDLVTCTVFIPVSLGLMCHRSTCLPISEPVGRSFVSLDAFRNPSFRGLFLFVLRTEAGSGRVSGQVCSDPRLLPAFLSSLHCTYDKGKKAPNNNNISDQHTVYLLFVSSVILFKSKQQGEVAS